MPSPFPGMDPYIKQSRLWVDFHNRLADEISAHLNQEIRPAYFARLTPFVTYEVVEIAQSHLRGIRPDVDVMQRPDHTAAGGGVAVLERNEIAAAQSKIVVDPAVELMSVEIRGAENELLVTTIEILSPVNKLRGHQGYLDYERKRRELLYSPVHLIEIDFLRGGEPVPSAPYYVTLSRAEQRPRATVWPIPLNAHLPDVPVPLQAPDPDVLLRLDEIVDEVYERGGYDAQIDYRQPPPPPPLTGQEVAWVEQLLAPLRKEREE